jgi:hypothetical protein
MRRLVLSVGLVGTVLLGGCHVGAATGTVTTPVLHGTVATTGAYSVRADFRFASQGRRSCREVASSGTTTAAFTLGGGTRITQQVVLNFGMRLAPYRGADTYDGSAVRNASFGVLEGARSTNFHTGTASENSAATRPDASGYAKLDGLTSMEGHALSVMVAWHCQLDRSKKV